jgi:DNA-binding NarL/FixJ family response regulator
MLLPIRRHANSIRVGVADANLMACGLLTGRLKRRFEVAGYATSRASLLTMVDTITPDVLLIGCHLEDGELSGLLALEELRSTYPNIHLVLLIDHSEREIVVQAFRAGAIGIFDRSESHFDRLCKCIACVHQGQIWANTQQLKYVVEAVVQAPSPWISGADGLNLLTKREEDLVRLVSEGLGNREIARKLNLSEHTIKNYMFRIFDKLGISNRVELVRCAVNNPKRPLMSIAGKEFQAANQEAKRLSDAS